MARRYVIRHKTTGDYLGLYPSLEQDPKNPPDISKLHVATLEEAASYGTISSAEMERRGIPDFADAYEVKTVELSSALDHPCLLHDPRARGTEEPIYPEDMF